MKKVAIVGFAKPTRAYAPYDDPDIEIWGCNEGYLVGQEEDEETGFMQDSKGKFRADRWFQIHPRFIINHNQTDPFHLEWLKNVKDMPIYMFPKQEDIPQSVEYPLDAIVDKYFGDKIMRGDRKIKLFSSTFDYMLALATYEKVDEVHVYGFEMRGTTEYFYQKPGAYLWLGIAISNGVKIIFHAESKFIVDSLYGIEVNMIVDRNQIEVQLAHIMAEEQKTVGLLNKATAKRELAEKELAATKPKKKVDLALRKFLAAMREENEALTQHAWMVGHLAFAQQLIAVMDFKADADQI